MKVPTMAERQAGMPNASKIMRASLELPRANMPVNKIGIEQLMR
jgi:hypothetical protein